LDNAVQIRTRKTLPRENLTDLFAFALRHKIDVTPLDRFEAADVVVLSFRAEKVARRHGKAVTHQIGKAHDDDDGRGQVSADDSRDDCEGCNRTVNASVDPITQVVLARSRDRAGQPLGASAAAFS
jgi:hypothetical protein